MHEDLLRLAILVALAEEGREGRAEVSTPARYSKVVRNSNVLIPDTVLYEEGAGTLTELLLVSGRNDFHVTVYADGALVIEGDFTSLQLISPKSNWVDVLEENGDYVVRVAGINFRESVKVDVRPVTEPFTLKQVLAKLDISTQV